uniref:Secreted protein n=1 Tax=Nelumbo nucifera TaxID=4432 RepID=A0A822YRH9_NELNU|nr:TPA_asm: hypothetical protein HUJ06_005768 [Nelumbo nucifera]
MGSHLYHLSLALLVHFRLNLDPSDFGALSLVRVVSTVNATYQRTRVIQPLVSSARGDSPVTRQCSASQELS